MDWGGSAPVVLFLVCLHAAQAYGASLTNVTFHCHNLHNVLRWGYDQSSPGLSFRLYIGTIQPKSGFPKDLWFDPPSHEVDLSFLSDPNNEYFLELTAMIANKSAAPSVELTFSYFKDSIAERKCSVDLPTVNVTALPDDNVKFQFTHPWLVYRKKLSGRSNLRHRKRSSNTYDPEVEETLPEFDYVVKMNQNQHNFLCEEQVCEETLPVDASQKKHCLTIVGDLERMRVQGTAIYCTEPYQRAGNPSNHIVPIVICAVVVFVVALLLVAFMVYKKKTKPSGSHLRIDISNSHRSTMKVERDEITVPVLEPASPTPLLPEPTTITPEITDDHIPRLMMEDEGVVGDAEVEQVSSEEPGYRCVNMDEDESENSNQGSGYERRPHVRQPTA